MSDTYRAAPGLNWSLLRHIHTSPAAYRRALTADSTSTAAQDHGTVLHLALLEPHRVPDRVAVWTEGRRLGAAYEAWAAEHDGKILLSESVQADRDCMDLAARLPSVIGKHDAASALLTAGKAETPLWWDEDGRVCKGLIDWLVAEPTDAQSAAVGTDEGQPLLVDVKFLRDLDRLESQAARYLYHGQLAHYAAGVEAHLGRAPAVFLLAVSKAKPADVAVLRLDTTDALDAGERLRQSLLARLRECEARDEWPGAYPGVTDLHLPAWAGGANREEM